MALIRRVLRVLLKRLHITLAVAQRIVRFLLSTFRHIRSAREFWNVTEVLIRSLIPEVQEDIHGTVEEDKLSEATSDRYSQQGTTSSVEGETENDASKDTIPTSDEEKKNLVVLVDNTTSNSGECLSVCAISDAVDDMEEAFADEDVAEPKSKGKITIDGLDLAVSKERLAEKIMLMERVVEFQPMAFLGLESCSTITSIGAFTSESDEFLAAMIESSSEQSVDVSQWEMRYDDIMITEVVELSSEGDVYRGSFNGDTVTVLTRNHQYPLHCLIKDVATIGKLKHHNIQTLVGYCCDTVKAVMMRNPGSMTLHHVVYKMVVAVEKKVEMLHQVVCGLQYLKENGLVLPWLNLKVVWLDNDLKRVCLELLNQEGIFRRKKCLLVSRLCYVPPEIVWQVCHSENNFRYAVNGPGNVYQFGVLCYELFLGQLPLEGVNIEQAEQVISSGEFTIPESISDAHTEMIRLCWNIDLWKRPTWEFIIGELMK